MKATEVTAGLEESNGSLLPGLWRDSLHVTCELTACTPRSAPGPTLGNEYGKTFTFFYILDNICARRPSLNDRCQNRDEVDGLADVCMSDYLPLMSVDGDRTVVTLGNLFKLSVNYCRTNTRKNFLANEL